MIPQRTPGWGQVVDYYEHRVAANRAAALDLGLHPAMRVGHLFGARDSHHDWEHEVAEQFERGQALTLTVWRALSPGTRDALRRGRRCAQNRQVADLLAQWHDLVDPRRRTPGPAQRPCVQGDGQA